MRSNNTKIPLIILCVLIISAFVPFMQIILLHLNGVFLYPFEKLLDTTSIKTLNYINLTGALISLTGYALSGKTLLKILWSILVVFFLSSYLSYALESVEYAGYPYFLLFMIEAVVIAIPLYIVGLIKEKREAR